MTAYECEDCGRNDHTSLASMMNCPCDKYDRNGRAIPVRGTEWLP